MSGNNEVKEFICSLGYDYQLGDSALIEGEENINTFLGCIFEKNRIGMDMICGDCSGDVINFKNHDNGNISFYTTDNKVEYQCKLTALFVVTNKENKNISPHIFLLSESTKLPSEARIESYESDKLKCAIGIILEDGTRSFCKALEEECMNSLYDPYVEEIKFERMKAYSFNGVIGYMNIQGMDFPSNPLNKIKKLTLDNFRSLKGVVK